MTSHYMLDIIFGRDHDINNIEMAGVILIAEEVKLHSPRIHENIFWFRKDEMIIHLTCKRIMWS